MNILIHRKSNIIKVLALSCAAFAIFISVFMKYQVSVHAASDSNVDSPVGDYITNIIGNSNFARNVLYRDMAHGFSVNAHGTDSKSFLDGYSNGIGGRFQKYCVDVLGFDENDVKKVTPIIQYSIDRSGGGASHSFGDRIVGAPIKGIMYTYERLIEGFCKWDAQNFKIQKENKIDFADDTDYTYLKNAILDYYNSICTSKLKLTSCSIKASQYNTASYKYRIPVAVYFKPTDSSSYVDVLNSYDLQNRLINCCAYILYKDSQNTYFSSAVNYSYRQNVKDSQGNNLVKINTSSIPSTYSFICSDETATINNFTNYQNYYNGGITIINNIFNTENYHEGDTLHNTDNLYSDEFSLNYNRIDGLYYIPIKVDTSNLTEEQKKNCPCEIVSLPQGDYLMLPITQDVYHMPDLNILKQLTDNNYCTQQDFTNQFRSIMNYTVINKDGDVYNYNNETVSKDTYYNEVNQYNKENYIPNGTDLTKIFPFCLPFDISRLLTPFNVEPVTPKFVVNFANFNSNIKFSDSNGSSDTSSGSTGGGSMGIDFDKLKIDELVKLLRTGEILLFTISLAIWFFKEVRK